MQRLSAPWQAPSVDTLFAVNALPAQVLAQRPDVRQAELAVAAASAEVGAAQADRYPRLSLAGTVSANTVRAGGATTDLQTWSIGPLTLTLPVLDAGRRAANTEAAKARYEEAVSLYRAQVRRAVSEVEQALVNLDSARARVGDARAAADGFRVSFLATQARHRAGLASLVELEDARRTQLAAETALVGLQRELHNAWISLYRAAGGGWQGQTDMGTPP
jgi:outer membrane protein TolC